MALKVFKFFKVFQRKDSIFHNAVRKQLVFSFIVNIIVFSHGVAVGWAAPTLRKLVSDETPLQFKVSIVEASWIASLAGLGSLFGNLLLSNLIDIIGRKPCLLIMALPNLCLWILIYLASSVEYLFVARFIGGLTGGSSIAVIPLFINEIANPGQRGAFQSFFIVAINSGILIGYVLSSKLSFYLVPCTVAALPIAYLLLLFYFPETPYHLIKKGRDECAIESIRFYKNYNAITQNCVQDYDDLKSAITGSGKCRKLSIKDFVTKSALKAYGLSFVLVALNQFSGIYTFITYMSDIFAMSGAPFEPDTCTIIIGVVQLFANFATIFFIDRYGRKILIVISSIGVILGLTAFGCFTYLRENWNLRTHTWVPLVLMIFVIFISNIGSVSVIVTSLVEILPFKIRSIAFSFFMTLLSLFVFIALKIFPICMHSWGISITMWSCAGITAICLLYLMIFLPETKGKSMEKD